MTEKLYGTVFNIQHYCIHDGPGIRTGIFLKGCPLHCLWCANPESQTVRPQIFWDTRQCNFCESCIKICPKNALSLSGSRIQTDSKKCDGCGSCAAVCPRQARTVSGKQMSVEEVMIEVLEDKLFMGTEGGITVTGGEATMQPVFTHALLQASKSAGITTAIETCGYTSWEHLALLAPLCDTFLYDVKLLDPVRHQYYTGQKNDLILSNLRKLAAKFPDCDIWIRMPVIPGVNDTENDIKQLGELASSLHSCSQVHLLPYHNLGEGKREQLGAPSSFITEIPGTEHMNRLRCILKEMNLCVF